MNRVTLLLAAIVLCANLCVAETFETVEIDTSSAESGAIVFDVTNGVPAVTIEESGLVCAMAVDATEGYSIEGEMLEVSHLDDADRVVTTNAPATITAVHKFGNLDGNSVRARGSSGFVILTENDNIGVFVDDGPSSGARVGINTVSPETTLDVDGDIHSSGDITVDGQITQNTGTATINALTVGSVSVSGNVYADTVEADVKAEVLQAYSQYGITFRDHYGNAIGILTVNGDLGIGTTAPSEALDVRGSIVATGTLEVSGPATLGGIGTIRGTETYTGLVYPGDSLYVIDGVIVSRSTP